MSSDTFLCDCPRAVSGLLNQLGQTLVCLSTQLSVVWGFGESKPGLTSSQPISILFTDVVGFSTLMTTWPLEVVASSLTDYFERLSRCVYRYEGQVDKFIGDGMMAIFQSPDEAVSAAYAIQREVACFNSQQMGEARCTFPTRIVVDTGLVVRAALGLGRDRDWTVIGPVVNAASHLAKVLPPGKVFISDSTLWRLTNRRSLHARDPQTIDGFGDEVVVYEVVQWGT